MKPALVISLLVLVGAGIAAVSVLGDRADRRVEKAFNTPCPNPRNLARGPERMLVTRAAATSSP